MREDAAAEEKKPNRGGKGSGLTPSKSAVPAKPVGESMGGSASMPTLSPGGVA